MPACRRPRASWFALSVPFSEKITETGAGENRKTIETQILSNNYMIKKLKMLSLAALATVAAVNTAQALTTNLLANVSIQFTVYSQGSPSTNSHTGTVTLKVPTSSVDTKELIAALGTDTNVTKTPFSTKAFLAVATPVIVEIITNVSGASTNYTTNLVAGASSVVVVDGTNVVVVPPTVISEFTPNATPMFAEVFTKTGAITSETIYAEATMTVNIPGQWVLSTTGFATVTVDNVMVGKGKAATAIPIYNSDLTLIGSGIEGTNTPVVITGKITESYLKTLIQ
jgi:hypothetical protein